MLQALGAGAWKQQKVNLAEDIWLVNTRITINHPGPAETQPLHSPYRSYHLGALGFSRTCLCWLCGNPSLHLAS